MKPILLSEDILHMDKLRLAMLYLNSFNRNISEIEEYLIDFTEEEINSLHFVKEIKEIKNEKYWSYNTDKEKSLFSFRPGIRFIIEEFLNGTLNQEKFPSLSVNKKEFKRNKSPLIIFVVGGISYTEMREIYQISSDRPIILGGDEIYTPKQFIKKLQTF